MCGLKTNSFASGVSPGSFSDHSDDLDDDDDDDDGGGGGGGGGGDDDDDDSLSPSSLFYPMSAPRVSVLTPVHAAHP